MRIVLDTNTIISAIGWKGKERSILDMCLNGKHELIESPQLMSELYTVLQRPKFSFIPIDKKEKLITTLISISEMVIPNEKVIIIKDDPMDNIVLECALAGRAEYIISGDNHLLS